MLNDFTPPTVNSFEPKLSFGSVESHEQSLSSTFSEVVSDLLTDKSRLSAVAQSNFDTWNTDGNEVLDEAELGKVVSSESATADQRMVAKIFSDNFKLASDISTPSNEPPRRLLTQSATDRYVEYFGGDTSLGGISRKDLSALAKLSAAGGQADFADTIVDKEMEAGSIEALIAGVGVLGLALGGRLIYKGLVPGKAVEAAAETVAKSAEKVVRGAERVAKVKTPMFDMTPNESLWLGVGTTATSAIPIGLFGPKAYNNLFTTGAPELNKLYKEKSDSLSTWKTV
ncbi:MAG: hypothetical protein C0507_09525 [Cyanobacteria bacterium PR.3.49]|nr:hypothetical protein [Cyanobacteria bacterium PR.3.49]